MPEKWIDDERLSAIVLNQTSDYVLVTDSNVGSAAGPIILFANRAICDLTGYSREELIGQTPRIFQGKDTDRTTLDRLQTALLAGNEFRGEILNYTKHGNSYWIELQISPVYNDLEEVVAYVSVQRDITHRKQDILEKERSERLINIGEKVASLGTWGMDLIVGDVHWSPGMFAILERDPKLGAPSNAEVLALIDDNDRANVSQMFDKIAQDGGTFQIEAQCSTYADRKIWLRVSGEAIVGENGETLAIVGATRDITSEKEVSEKLATAVDINQQLSRDFSTARSIAKIGIFDYSVKNDLQRWSDELLEMTGLDKHSFPAPADRFISRIDANDRPRFEKFFNDAVQNGTPYEITILFHRPDGKDMHMQIVADVKDDSDGRRIVGIARDVTEEVKASELLRVNEERFRLIADSASDVLWDHDLESGFTWSSTDWPSKLGVEVEPGKLQGFQWMEMVDPSDRESITRALQSVIKSDATAWETEFKVYHAEGQIIDLAVTASILRHADGRASRILGTIRNVTQERRTQEGYTRARALEAVGQLTGGIAHDFNNLLMIILGNVELLEMSGLGEEDAETVSAIAQAAESAAQLTRQLLTFTRQSQLERTRVDVAKLVSDLTPLLRAGLPDVIRFSQSFAFDLWPADVDANSLQQALVNLAMNAKDAMPRGGEIVVSGSNLEIDEDMVPATTDLRPGRYVTISVSDTGDGMPPEVLARALEPFFTTKDVGKGTGLGLSTVYGFAKQSNGGVSIYSEPGRGTTVNLYLPAAEGEALEDSQSASRTEAERQVLAKRILVVEDQLQVRAHVEKTLVRLGYVVATAQDAASALTMLKQGEAFDLLFTDIIMPGGMNGQELGEAALQLVPHMKILYTSGYPAAAFEHLGLKEQSSINFLSKPYKASHLQTMLADIFDAQL